MILLFLAIPERVGGESSSMGKSLNTQQGYAQIPMINGLSVKPLSHLDLWRSSSSQLLYLAIIPRFVLASSWDEQYLSSRLFSNVQSS